MHNLCFSRRVFDVQLWCPLNVVVEPFLQVLSCEALGFGSLEHDLIVDIYGADFGVGRTLAADGRRVDDDEDW